MAAPNITLTQIAGIDETVRIVLARLNPFAAKNKIPNRQEQHYNLRKVGNIEIWFSMEEVGVARFHLVTKDDVDVDVRIDFADITSEYLNNMVEDVKSAVNKHKAERRKTDLHLVSTNGVTKQ